MPSIMTLEGGAPIAAPTPKKKRPRRKRGPVQQREIGFCKKVHNPRTRKEVDFCFVGKSASTPTGWRFMTPTAARALQDRSNSGRRR
jgi:hypothetical protein